jgi:hypothetical protein
MAIIAYTSPKGLDREIFLIQNKVYDSLIAKGWTLYNCYPRAYVNKKDDKNFTIEYALNNKDYQEVLFNDKINASSFFVLTRSDKKDLRLEKAMLSLIFQVNATKIKPSVTTRIADEDIVNEITTILYKLPYSIKMLNVKRGIKDVYSDLGVNMSERNTLSDFFICRFDIELYYTLNEPTTTTNQII